MIKIAICLALLFAAAAFARLGRILLSADATEAEKNVSRMRSPSDAIMGRVTIHNDWVPDARVQGGMVYNAKDDRIEVCGRVSDESLDRTFR